MDFSAALGTALGFLRLIIKEYSSQRALPWCSPPMDTHITKYMSAWHTTHWRFQSFKAYGTETHCDWILSCAKNIWIAKHFINKINLIIPIFEHNIHIEIKFFYIVYNLIIESTWTMIISIKTNLSSVTSWWLGT